ncbi:Cna B-type domain-containing protein [Oribacterium parvum]|uniref:Cna B-type domain-containing protein n=1 Tax=Oribacterium parvum TaxID=1501329 RepID=UPI0028DCE943|nr:Cna B-type domain-containing protein [Oribacterium parvum]
MKAKRQILSLLLALVMVWQGFSFANAEGSSNGTALLASANTNETTPSPGESTEETVLSTSESTNEAELFTSSSSTELEASDESDSTVPMAAALSTSLESTGKQIENAIYDPEFLINNDTPLQDGGSLGSYQNLQFKAKIKVQGLNIKENDYISIQLPKQLKSTDTSFNISGTGGKILAKGTYNQATKEIRIIFTKDAENYSGTDGEVYFSTRIDQDKVASMTSDPFKLEINGQTVINYNIKYNIVTRENPKSFYKDRDFHLYKVVDKDGNTHYLIHYTMTLDTRNIQKVPGATSYENIVFTDTLQSNALSYFDVKNHFTDLNLNQADIDKYAPVLRKGIWRSGAFNQDGVWENAPDDSDANRGNNWSLRNRQNPDDFAPAVADSPNYSADGRSFSYSLGTLAPDDGYELSYYVEINEAFKNGDKFNNLAELTGKGIVPAEKLRDFVVSEAGGFLNGQNFSIQIKKVGEEGEALQGAKFTLVNPKTKYTKTIVTDEHGIAKLENVLKADYVLTEVEAPKGYEKDSTPRTISKKDFEDSVASGSTITLTIKNEKEEVKKKSTSFSVEKYWVLDSDPNLATNKPEKVKVFVLKNGDKDENLSVELSAANDWKASFSNLPKEDANGREIVYTLSEEEVAGFNAAISGSDENKFTITNYNGGNVVIPVTKKWKGSGAHPDHVNVQLFANGAKVDSSILNAENNWQHNFVKPKYDASGNKINYTVTEDNVSGYTATTQDDPATGYVNVFVNTKNDVPPTSPNGGGNGGGGNGGGGNPPKPSPNTPGTPTEPTPGNVLGKNRDPESNPETVATVLGVDKTVPSVLGAGRGIVKTEDTSRMPIYLLFFALSACGLTATVLYERKRAKR